MKFKIRLLLLVVISILNISFNRKIRSRAHFSSTPISLNSRHHRNLASSYLQKEQVKYYHNTTTPNSPEVTQQSKKLIY